MTFEYTDVEKTDPDLADMLRREFQRQEEGLELIPSENFVSEAVLEALGSVPTNKYSEGYPGKRYYGGCHVIDEIEQLAIDRAKELFGAEHVNVQPLSGAPMNIAVYQAFAEPGDTILGMDLSHGGHLTHGHPVTLPAKVWNFVRYKTNPETGEIDYDELLEVAKREQPKIVLAGFSAYSREIDYERVHAIAQEVGAISMMDMAHIGGLVAGGVISNPVPVLDVVTTTTHKSLRGPRGGMILCKKEHAKKINKSVFPGLQGGPHENQIAALAVALKEALQPEFKEYSQQILDNAKVLCDALKEGGLKIMFGDTENHLILADVTPLGLTGQQAETALDEVGMTLNKNMIPDDPRKPMDPSGIRLGTPGLTTRGMKEPEMKRIAEMMLKVLNAPEDEAVKEEARALVAELTTAFPLYKK